MNSETLFQQDIVLENERVRLVSFAEEHFDELKKIAFDEEVTRFAMDGIETDDDLKRYVEGTIQDRLAGKAYPFIIIDKATGEVAGTTRFGYIIHHNKRLEIGWTWYGRAFRGTGLNKACKYELLKFAFETLGFQRVQLSADVDNVRSQKAILKLGAKQEGVFRSNYLNAAGESRDDVYFSMISLEWPELKRTVFGEFL